MLERAVTPAVEVPVVSAVQGDAEIVQKIRRAGPCAGSEGRLDGHGIPFGESLVGVEPPDRRGPELADDPVQRSPQPPARLELGQMPGFMDRKGKVPGRRVRIIGIHPGKKVHPHRRVHHRTVGKAMVGVKDHRGMPDPLRRSGRHAGGAPRRFPVLLQIQAVTAREGIQPGREKKLIMRRFQRPPPKVSRVGSMGEDLGRKRLGKGTEQQTKREQLSHKETNLIIFTYICDALIKRTCEKCFGSCC